MILTCKKCGHKWRSFTSSAIFAVGNVDACPRCSEPYPVEKSMNSMDMTRPSGFKNIFADGEMVYGLKYTGLANEYEICKNPTLANIASDFMKSMDAVSDRVNELANLSPDKLQDEMWGIIGKTWSCFENSTRRYCEEWLAVGKFTKYCRDNKIVPRPIPEKFRFALRENKSDELKKICDWDDFKAIDYLYNFKNAIHNDCLASEEFLEGVRNIPAFSSLVVHDPISLDPLTVCSLMNSVDVVFCHILKSNAACQS